MSFFRFASTPETIRDQIVNQLAAAGWKRFTNRPRPEEFTPCVIAKEWVGEDGHTEQFLTACGCYNATTDAFDTGNFYEVTDSIPASEVDWIMPTFVPHVLSVRERVM